MSNYEEVYKKVLGKWGFDNQVDMIIEECAELIKALQKHKRVKKNTGYFRHHETHSRGGC